MAQVVRPATPADVPELVAMVHELAAYERAADEVVADAGRLTTALFAPAPAVFAHVAELDGAVVGFALWFLTFSTWLGRHGVYVEDLYVREPARGRGLGRALLAALARLAVERGYGRLEWSVLDWNEPAIGFYRRLGAQPMSEWTVHRLAGPALAGLAAGDSGAGSAAPDPG